MARMAELVARGAVPEPVLKRAAAGQLSIAPEEMLEVLVLLTAHATLGEQARQTLADWPEDSLRQMAAKPDAPGLVIRYFLAPATRRRSLAESLIAHPEVSENTLAALAYAADAGFAHFLLSSARVQNSPAVLRALSENPELHAEKPRIQEMLNRLGGAAAEPLDYFAELWTLEREAEIEAEAPQVITLLPESDSGEESAPAEATPEPEAEKEERMSTLQKLNKMTVSQRVKIAMLGNKEQRSILIRDGSRVVYSAVLASSKLSGPEIETIASMKNVQEGVLREMARTRKFMKSYNVIRALANNPRCPMDIALGLIKNLIVPDLKVLSMNKNVPETVRKVALRNFKQKSAAPGKKAE